VTSLFIDTNVFLRYLLDDDPILSPAAREVFEAIEGGSLHAWTSDLVVAELVFVLSSKRQYAQPAEAIARALLPLLQLPNLKLPNKAIYERAFALYVDLNIDYIDAFHAALMEREGKREILSFDADFDRVQGIVRHERIPA
jgi:predicted nucleic acid-binding protein